MKTARPLTDKQREKVQRKATNRNAVVLVFRRPGDDEIVTTVKMESMDWYLDEGYVLLERVYPVVVAGE